MTKVVDTNLYSSTDLSLQKIMDRYQETTILPVATTNNNNAKEEDCCVAKEAAGEAPCCGSKRKRTESEWSELVFPATAASSSTEPAAAARHATRFGITSFVYKSRRPFHPLKFHQNFVDKYFLLLSLIHI